MVILSAFTSGLLFGLGLIISQMINRAKVLAFLDVFGRWDPSLALVMVGAVAASSFGYVVRVRLSVLLSRKLSTVKSCSLYLV